MKIDEVKKVAVLKHKNIKKIRHRLDLALCEKYPYK